MALCRLDILVYAKEVCRIVFPLDGGQTIIVAAVGCLDTFLALVHHEVHIGATGVVQSCIVRAPDSRGRICSRIDQPVNYRVGLFVRVPERVS